MKEGTPVAAGELGHVDLVVCDTVAANYQGVRIGKGGGYSDLELALLTDLGLVDGDTTTVTPVHSLQVLDDSLAEADHDFRVDVIVTPEEVIRTKTKRRSPGVLWDHLDDETIDAIPVLASRRPAQS